MKKKQVNLDRKLFLNKETLAELNNIAQYQVQGGAAPTFRTICVTRAESCPTIPYTENACKPLCA